jgi:very-short-patch-repair endonuclease
MQLSEREKLERLLWQRIDWARLPLPVLQYHWAKSEGRQFRSDGAYVAERILLEVQGGIWAQDPGRHNRGSGYEKDLERSNLAAILGWKLLAFSERMIKDGSAVRTIARALGRDEPAQPQLIGGEH